MKYNSSLVATGTRAKAQLGKRLTTNFAITNFFKDFLSREQMTSSIARFRHPYLAWSKIVKVEKRNASTMGKGKTDTHE